MRKTVLVLALIAAPVSAQTLNCSTIGNTTHCSSPPSFESSGPLNDVYSNLLNSGKNIGSAFAEGRERALREKLLRAQIEAARQSPTPAPPSALADYAAERDRSSERRKEAYSQVGSLIAAGKCEEAKRLAAFYGQVDIMADTAKACPN